MSTASVPEVECEQEHASLPVSDVRAAVDFYTNKLGFRLGFTWGDPPTIAGVNLGNVQMFLEQGTSNPAGCAVYFVVGNADELYEFQRANGVDVIQTPGDRPYGLRDYRVRDLNGYELGFGQHLFNAGPPIEIERVDCTCPTREAPGCTPVRSGGIQAPESQQLPRRDAAAHARRRRDRTRRGSSSRSRNSKRSTGSTTTATAATGSSNGR